MLFLNKINIRFPHKTIFEDTSFTAYPGEITVIQGSSGIGKSTLLDALLFKHDSEYYYNDELVIKDEHSDFIYNHISYVKQIPTLIEELTINEHISIIKKTYSIEDIKEEYQKRLNISSLIDKYPSKLSQGEKVRIAIYLAIIKEPDILILDEPTASLDGENKEILISFLKEYASLSHIVICASHDSSLIESSDTLYNIENKKLIKDREYKHNDIENNQNYKKDNISFYKIHRNMDKFKRLFNIMILIVVSASLTFTFISFSLNNNYISILKQDLKEFSSTELLLYQNTFEANTCSFEGREFSLSDDTVDKIKAIDGVKSVEWRYDINNKSFFSYLYKLGYDEDDNSKLVEKHNTFEGYASNKKINDLVSETVYLHTYIDDMDYSSAIEKTYSDNGVYLSSSLYSALFGNEEVKEPTIGFYMMVPLYNSTGISFEPDSSYTGSDDRLAPANFVSCQPVYTKIPVKGVLTGSVLSQEDSSNPYHIYISQSDMKKYIDKYSTGIEKQTINFISEENKYYLNTVPKGYTMTDNDQVVVQTAWKPNSYSIIVDDIADMDDVADKIKKMGLRVENIYFNTQNLLNVENSTRRLMIGISSVILGIVLVSYFVLNYINKDKYKKSDEYLKYLGYNKRERNKFNKAGRIYNFIKLLIVVVIEYLAVRYALIYLHITVIRPDIRIFIGMAAVTFIIQDIYPMILQRKYIND